MNRATIRTIVGFVCAAALLLAACAPAATPAPKIGRAHV